MSDDIELYQFHNHLNILIKPTEACNLRCVYCFHRNEGYDKSLMSIETLDHLFKITFPHYKSINITWHGGEPTIAGVQFYKKAFELEQYYSQLYGTMINNSMQSNGTLFSQELIDVLKQGKVNIGVSYDGVVNDLTRNDTAAVNEKRTLLEDNRINAGIITVVSSYNVDRLIENYEIMKKEKRNVQFNHYIETEPDNPIVQLHMDVNHYIEKMSEFFDYWVNDEGCNIDVQPFTQLILEVLFDKPMVCSRASCHRSWLCIDHNGKLIPCDKVFPEKYNYGYVSDYDDIRQIYSSEGFSNLINAAICRRRKCMEDCDVYRYCEGGCSHSAMVEGNITDYGGFTCKTQRAAIKKVLGFIEDNELTVDNFQDKIKNPILVKVMKRTLIKQQKINS